jgi:hypothetical protein
VSKVQSGVLATLALFGPVTLTRHGKCRSQQRSIKKSGIEMLIDFGQEEPAGNGCHRYFFTKRTWDAATLHLGPRAKEFERYRSAYVVVADDGQIVTVGWIH